jgi:hypothetical protein
MRMTRPLRFIRWSLAALTFVFVASNPASAQIGGIGPSPLGSPLGMTSPLGIGPAPAVPRTGIPMGATELSSPGVSPMTSGTSPLGAAPGNITTCSSIGGSFSGTTGTSGSSTTFDGGGMGNASGTCAGLASGPSAGPASSASSPTGMGLGSPVGRLGIPLGSTELGVGGLSPPPDVSSTPSAPLSTFGTPCPTGTPAATAMSSGSC